MNEPYAIGRSPAGKFRITLSDALREAIAEAASASLLCALCLFVPKKSPAHVHDDDGTVEGCPGCFWDPDDRIVNMGGHSVCVDHAGYFQSDRLSDVIRIAAAAQRGERP